jgi:chromosome partitioning protein
MVATVETTATAKLEQLFLHPSKDGMLALEWPEFEDFIQYVFQCAGYHVTKVSPYHQKHHVDLELRHKPEGKVIAHVEVRRYSIANIIKARVLQFLGALDSQKVPHGYLITTSDFTQPAYAVAEASGGKLRLMNSVKLLRYIRYVSGSRVTGEDIDGPSLHQPTVSPTLLFDAESIPRLAPEQTTVLAIANNKGGVAKTTTALNLAFALSEKHQHRVLLVDLDGQASLTAALADDAPPSFSLLDYFMHQTPLAHLVQKTRFDRLWLITADERLFRLNLSGEQWQAFELAFARAVHDGSLVTPDGKPFDWIILDTPPAQAHFTRVALAACHYVLFPATPETQAVNGLNRAFGTAKTMQALMSDGVRVLGGVVTRAKKGGPAEQALVGMREIMHANGSKVYPTEIPEDTQIERAHQKTFDHKRVNIFNIARRQGAAAEAYEKLMKEVLADVQHN